MNIRRGLWETRVIEPVFYDDEGGVLLTSLPPFLSRHRLIEKTPKASDFVEKQSSCLKLPNPAPSTPPPTADGKERRRGSGRHRGAPRAEECSS
ncbi:hypothetical protein QC764_0060950 [Podospora pseudoanserina]|uniref:Uncharacterized protein n=1 Tax=Podospora pseudoanserina TaxID=2609844 RepID=A0ABR0I8K0_9PEZI|nr:hypothetical protein QC764_0060950 [Podospora pseudoanserina]